MEALAGQPWILLEGDYELLIPAPFEAVWSVVSDYESYPGVFGRIEAVEVERLAPGSVRLRQKTVIRVAGIAFPSECLLELSERLEGEARKGQIGFSSLSTDGSLLEIGGGWSIEGVGTSCYVRYRLNSLVRRSYPLQAEIMGAFADFDFFALLRDLEKAAVAKGFR